MAILGTYDPNKVALVAVGIPISGFQEGTMISIEKNEEAFSLQIGTNKEGCRTRVNNDSCRITFTLLQSSASNLLLSTAHNVDLQSGDGIAPSIIQDFSGTTLVTAENSWVVKMPTVEFNSTESTSREWIIETDEIIMGVGNN